MLERSTPPGLLIVGALALLLVAVFALGPERPGFAQQPGSPTVSIFVPNVSQQTDPAAPTSTPTPPPGSTATPSPTATPFFPPTPNPAGGGEGFHREDRTEMLAVSLAASPAFPVPGEAVSITVSLRNESRNVAQGVEVRLQADGEDIGATTLNVPANRAGEAFFTWTAGPAGLRVLLAEIDPSRALREFNRLDNYVTGEVIVADAPPAGADFQIANLALDQPLEGPPSVAVTIGNGGTATGSAPVQVAVGGVPIGSAMSIPIAPGGFNIVNIPWPTDLPLNAISAEVNPRFRTAETNPADNLGTIDPRLPVDLRVEGLSVSAETYQEGRPRRVTISGRISNAGNLAVTTPFSTTVMPGTMIGAIPSVYRFTIEALAPGEAVSFSRTIETPESDFDIRVEADSDNVVPEDDESNNVEFARYENPDPNLNRWVSIGPRKNSTNSIGVLCTFAAPPGSSTILYAGCFRTGLWKSTNGGASWQPIADTLPTLQISALTIDPSNVNRIYLATGTNGLYRSDNAGSTWTAVTTANLNLPGTLATLFVSPANAQQLTLATMDGVKRSTDGGTTWTTTLNAGGGTGATGLVMDAASPNILYAALSHPTDNAVAGIYRSQDFGATWTKLGFCVFSNLPAQLAGQTIRISISDSKLYASFRGTGPGGATYSLRKMSQFNCTINGVQDPVWELSPFVPTNAATLWSGIWSNPIDPRHVYLGGTVLFYSSDFGDTFSPVNDIHVDNHRVAFDPSDPKTVYALNDGGIYKSGSFGAPGTWISIGEGLLNYEFYDIANAPTDPKIVIGGTQDNGTNKYIAPDTLWTHYQGGDGATVDVDPTNAQILFQMGQYAPSITRSTDGGGVEQNISGGLPTGAVCPNLHFQVHPKIPTTMLASCDGSLWRTQTTDPPGAWSRLFTPATGAIVRSTVDSTIDRYYAGANNGRIYAATGGVSFSQVFTHPNGANVTDLEVDLDVPTALYVSFGGTGTRRVYRLQRFGTSLGPMGAQDITSNLPAGIVVQTIGIDRNTPLTIYAGTNRGIYRGRSADGGSSWIWTNYSNGMPQGTDVRDIEVHPSSGVLRAGTFGRGAYEALTGSPIGSVLAVSGRIALLRVHDVGTGYGPPLDSLDAEAIVWIDSEPGKAFGFKLRWEGIGDDVDPGDPNSAAAKSMLDLLRSAFNDDKSVRIDYVRTGLRNGRIIRVAGLP